MCGRIWRRLWFRLMGRGSFYGMRDGGTRSWSRDEGEQGERGGRRREIRETREGRRVSFLLQKIQLSLLFARK